MTGRSGFLLRSIVGAVLTETVFSWPGVGRSITDSILTRDYPAVQGSLLCLVTMVMLFNLSADALHAWLDPRAKTAS